MSHRDEIARAAGLLSELRSKLLSAGNEEAAKLVQSAFRSLRRAGRLLGEPSLPEPRQPRPAQRPPSVTPEMLEAAAAQLHPAKARRAARRARRLDPTDIRAGTHHNLALDSSTDVGRQLPPPAHDGTIMLVRWLREIRLAVLIGDSDPDRSVAGEILARATRRAQAATRAEPPSEPDQLVRWLVRIAARRTPAHASATSSTDPSDRPGHDRARQSLIRARRELLARKAS